LFTLSKRFNLKHSNSFDNYVKQYDNKYLTKRCFKYFSINECLTWSVREENIEIVNKALKRGANDYNWAMASAAKGWHKEMVRVVLDLGADDYNWAMNGASSGGHKEIVQMMLDSGANNYNAAMSSAAKYWHKEIVQMIKNYAKNF
jgi:hypothetical protein